MSGPNLNLPGKREPSIYGREALADIEADCRRAAAEVDLDIRFHQNNAGCKIIDWNHEAQETAADIVTNAAATFTHASMAILDALKPACFSEGG